MKIKIFILVSILIPILNIVSANNSFSSDLDIGKIVTNDIQNIYFRFCNDGLQEFNLKKLLKVDARPGSNYEVCGAVYNDLQENIPIKLKFLPVSILSGRINCANSGVFDSGIILSGLPNDLYLTGKKTQIIYPRISFTKDITYGKHYVCISYNMDPAFRQMTIPMFNLIVRKSVVMTFNVTGSVYNRGLIDDIKYGYKDNRHFIRQVIVIIIGLLLVFNVALSFKKKDKKHNHKK